MKMREIINICNEAVGRAVLFHWTGADSLAAILTSNELQDHFHPNRTDADFDSKNPEHLADLDYYPKAPTRFEKGKIVATRPIGLVFFTRNPKFEFGGSARLVFDWNKLRQQYKVQPFNNIRIMNAIENGGAFPPFRHQPYGDINDDNAHDEYAEVVEGTVKNINRYLLSVEIPEEAIGLLPRHDQEIIRACPVLNANWR